MFIKRESYLKNIRPFYDTPVVKVLTGMRRCGKSVMLQLIKDDLIGRRVSAEHMLSFNFESFKEPFLQDVHLTYNEIETFTNGKKGRVYFFFDEIQELTGWERLVNSCLIDFNCDIYITGSNASLLSGELATYLAGRYIEFSIYPFSFAEIVLYLEKSKKPINRDKAFLDYLTYGGLPFLLQFDLKGKEAITYLEDIFNSIIVRDIATRAQVRDIELLKRLIVYLMANIGRNFSSKNIINYLKSEKRSLSNETIYNYIEYCKRANLLHLVPRYNIQGKELLKFNEKIFLTDHGLREAIYGNNQRDIELILENIVFLELKRNGYAVCIGKTRDKEVDFIATKPHTTLYIQVTYLLASEETIEREFSALESIDDNYPKYVLSMDTVLRNRGGIIHRNIKDFLLTEAFTASTAANPSGI
ncbi:MAG: ATP-binding protein [Sphaerochaetaceae bacterium]|nr:ATP-binding protein [Sphaerochaetaceae bacterium]